MASKGDITKKHNKDIESNFWDLGDDDETLDHPLSVEEIIQGSIEQGLDIEGNNSLEETSEKNEDALEEFEEFEEFEERDKEPTTTADHSEKTLAATPAAEEPTESKTEKPPEASPSKSKFINNLSSVEKISLSIFTVALCLLAILGARQFFNHEWKKNYHEEVDYPVKGELIEVTSLETWWRKPIREGENIDLVRSEAKYIPCAKVSVGPESNGQIRFIIHNGEGKHIGDPITLDVKNGVFEKNGESTITFNGTQGLIDDTAIHVYANNDMKAWKLLTYETANRAEATKTLLFTELISTKLKE